jgi:ATP-dependent 26S proteasome regulatory subunit
VTITVKDALENIYASLMNDNADIDAHIASLKTAMQGEGVKAVAVEAARLAQNNRQGRKMMQSYFKKRGVAVTFTGVNDQ